MSSSTSSFKRWLLIFFVSLGGIPIPFLAASEWMLRTYVVPLDNFERISQRLRESSIPNAAFGDSHVAAVSSFNDNDFVNLGIGATTIRRMASRVYYYYGKVKPGKVIIEADPHLFADYRLETQGTYIPESYAPSRLRVFDERHRRYMFDYWKRFIQQGALVVRESSRPQQLWEAMRNEPAITPSREKPARDWPSWAAATPVVPNDPLIFAEFNAFIDWEVKVHTPVHNFRERDEARIYREMLDFLIARGAKVCLVNFPVDRHYRVRANATPEYAAVREFYKDLAVQRGIPYVSFWDRFDDPSMFQNTDHVNRKGGAILDREARAACFGDK